MQNPLLLAVFVFALFLFIVFNAVSRVLYRRRHSDIVKNGIYLAGGGALLRGLDKRLTEKMHIQFHVPEDPLHSVAKGAGVALKNLDRFNFLMR